MEQRISKAQRAVLTFGAIGILHSSMVPPVSQGGEYVCRYHEFVERRGAFSRGYEVANGDMVALVSEYGIVLAATAVLYLVLGFFAKD